MGRWYDDLSPALGMRRTRRTTLKLLAAGAGLVALRSSGVHALGAWTPTGSLLTARQDHTATLLPDGKVLVVAGETTNQFLASAELYDPTTGRWTATGSMANARWLHTVTLLHSGKALAVGGFNTLGNPLETELYDRATGNWTPSGELNTARFLHTATLLPNGKVLAAGGFNTRADLQFLTSAELYDPSSGSWAPTGSMHTARYGHLAVLLGADAEQLQPFAGGDPKRKVLVAGGWNATGYLSSAELYDPSTGSWAPTGGMAWPRSYHIMVRLLDGKVLAAGGVYYESGESDGEFLASAELYDPESGVWKPTGSLQTARGYFAAAVLLDGRVLVSGGVNADTWLSSAEVYNPATGRWTSAGTMSSPRVYHTMTRLPTGSVLIAAGSAQTAGYLDFESQFLASAEIYRSGR